MTAGGLGIDSIVIRLESTSLWAGQELRGAAVVNVSGADGVRARSVRIAVCGEADVHWTESHTTGVGDRRKTVTHTYASHEKYFEYSTALWPLSVVSSDDLVLPARSHSFPFRFRLPENVPSSFEGRHGWVRYFAKVTVDRPWAIDDAEKVYFNVAAREDLNSQPRLAEPVTLRDSKEFYTLLFNRGEVAASVTLNRSGFVPGENVLVSADVTNRSKVTITELRAELRQRARFRATNRGKTRTNEKTLDKIYTRENLTTNLTGVWRERPLTVPAVAPSQLRHCSFIDVDYVLRFSVVPSGMHLSLCIDVPLTVGTVPFIQARGSDPGVEAIPSAPPPPYFGPTQQQHNPSAPPLYENCPGNAPPTYAEATGGSNAQHHPSSSAKKTHQIDKEDEEEWECV